MQLGTRHLQPGPGLAAIWSRLMAACEPSVSWARGRVQPYWQQATQWYEKREPREKLLLKLLGGLVAVLFIYSVVYLPLGEWHEDLSARVESRRLEVIRVRAMMRNYERLRLELVSTQKRTVPGGKDPALFSVLEMTLTNSVGHEKIGSITPSEHQVPGGFEQYTVDVKLNEIALAEIVNALYSLQSLNVPITVANLQIHQHARDSHAYDVELTCTALGKSG